MSYSPNSETTLSRQHETKTFEKFGMEFRYGVVTNTEPEWESKAGTLNGQLVVDWTQTGKTHTSSYVEFAMVKDQGFCAGGNVIEVYATADGPIMGINIKDDDHEITLVDPCIVMFDGKVGNIQLMPIFNVARKLRLKKAAIRSVQAPAEVLLAAYPGFLINNRMAKYQLKPRVPFAATPELTNDAS